MMTSQDDEINNNVVGVNQFANNDRSIQCTYNNANGNVMCLLYEQLNFDEVPISILSIKSKEVLSKQLNPLKVIPSENGLSRDWRGFLQLATNRSDYHISKTDPMKEVLECWSSNHKNATLGQLVNILQSIDRWDVIDDARECFRKYKMIFVLHSILMKKEIGKKNIHFVKLQLKIREISFDPEKLFPFLKLKFQIG